MNKTTPAPTAAATNLPLPITIAALALLAAGLVITVPSDPEWWKVIILGIVQGVTEWLPISSTGHLLLTANLLDYQGSIGGTFEIFIQIGTVLSVVAFYFSDLIGQVRALIGQGSPAQIQTFRRFWLVALIAFLPAALVGLTLRDFIKTVLFESPTVIAIALIVGGAIFLAIELWPRRAPHANDLSQISPRQALGIGFAQICALIPGISRSGSSIVGGLLAGLDRRTATAFSFYLSVPVLGLATLVDLLGSLDQIQPADWSRLLLGAVVAMIVGYVTIGWLLRYISRNTFVAFGIYRIIAGLIILGLVSMGQL